MAVTNLKIKWKLCNEFKVCVYYHCHRLLLFKMREMGGQDLAHNPTMQSHIYISVQSLSCVQLSATPWTAAHQASLFITNSRRLLKLMSTDSVMPSSHLILCRPLFLLPSIFPIITVFTNESALHIRWPSWSFCFNITPSNEHFTSGGQAGVSASTSVLPMNNQDWSPLGWTGWISLQFKGASRVFSNTTVQKH